MLSTILSHTGALALALVALSVLRWVWSYFLTSSDLSRYGAKKGAWAVVTGASDGIGKGIAFALAARGFNVVLVSRTLSKLEAVATELKAKYGKAETMCIACDVGAADMAGSIRAITQPLAGKKVTMLVNNVGVAAEFPAELTDHSTAEVESIIRVNCLFTAQLTRAFVPILKANASPRAAIAVLGSISSIVPAPLMSVYAGAKAFDDAFAYALAAELAPHKIDVTSILPGYVVSSMSGFKRPSLLVPSAAAFGHIAVNAIGTTAKKIPYWAHALYVAAITSLPDSFTFPQAVSKLKVARTKLMARKEKDAAQAK